ncbi:MAG TPA: hypothetical protein VK658_21865 [Chryseolinea sp.]|nr:hypothetical protein [Chryseolinea sp.]
MKLLFSIILTVIALTSYGQLSRKEKKAARKGTAVQPTTLSPGSEDADFVAPSVKMRKEKKKSRGITYNAQKEYDDRMASRAKTNRYNERMLMKPQYANPAYFGHKRKPKRHAPGKLKYCKECGIRH